MPKRIDIKSVLIIGAGPIVIGQACEFDYSGAQACKALKEEGLKVILVNSNPATIMTDPELADVTYIEPINTDTIEKIIKVEKPDAILPTMGGQTALNIAIELDKAGILKKFFCVAELHRWHHRADFKDAQVNYGAWLTIWDYIFKTSFDDPKIYTSEGIGEIGIAEEPNFPKSYLKQIAYPFRK